MRMDARMAKLIRKPKNLSLDPDAIARGERYSQLNGTTLSRLVSDFLRSLPLGKPTQPLAPAVRRLRGVLAGSKADRATYREHLRRKYGSFRDEMDPRCCPSTWLSPLVWRSSLRMRRRTLTLTEPDAQPRKTN